MRKAWSYALLILALVSLPAAAQQLPRQQQVLRSAHFEIHYDTVGADAVSETFVEAVRAGLEMAYDVFVIREGFRFPKEPVRIHLLASLLGSNTFGATFVPFHERRAVIVLNDERTFRSAASFLQETLKLPTSSTRFLHAVIAHELFHVIQREYDFTEALLAESTAVWAAEHAVPDSDDYVFNALDLLLGGTDFAALPSLNPSYALGLFWMTVVPERGGAAFIRELLETSRLYDGLDLLDRVFARHGTSFLDAWSQFALRLQTRQVHDAEVIYPAAEALSGLAAPVPALVIAWRGGLQSVRTLQGQLPLLESPFGAFADPAASPLRVAHAFGIDYVRLQAQAGGSLLLRFQGDASSAFRVGLVHEREGELVRVRTLDEADTVRVPDLRPGDVLTVVVTRGAEGTGRYALFLAPGAPTFARWKGQA